METREWIKTEEEALSEWGFEKDYCFRCKKHNSELSGLLMQCGKCKKAYYCSMKCFNEDLIDHQKYCNTKRYCNRDPDRVLATESPCTPTSQQSTFSKKKGSKLDDLVSLSSKKSSTSKKSKKSTTSKKSKKSDSDKKKKKKSDKKTGEGTTDHDGQDKSANGTGQGGSDSADPNRAKNGDSKDGNEEKDQTEGGGNGDRNGDEHGNDKDQDEIVPTEIFLGDGKDGKDKAYDPNASNNSSWRGFDGNGSRGFNPNESWISNGYADASWISRDGSDDEEDDGKLRSRFGRSAVSFDDINARSKNYSVRTPDQFDEKDQAAKEVVSLCSVTQEHREVGWEKPAWSSELDKLRKTKNGTKLRSGEDVVRPISQGVDE